MNSYFNTKECLCLHSSDGVLETATLEILTRFPINLKLYFVILQFLLQFIYMRRLELPGCHILLKEEFVSQRRVCETKGLQGDHLMQMSEIH